MEEELKEVFSSRQGFLYDLLRYHLGWTDERGNSEYNTLPLHFPSLLALVACEALSGDFHSALPAAAGVELVYNFTLVHGDVQSGRPEARDRPSIWWVWGPAQAINAGDGLHALGRTTIMRLAQRGTPAERVLRSVQSMDRACLSLCEGQYMELDFQDRQLVTEEAYYQMISLRSGSLTGCSAELGSLAAGAGESEHLAFYEMGRLLGMAGQITRDVEDTWGPNADGITPSNAINKKKSLPLIHAMATAPVTAKRQLASIYVKRTLDSEDLSKIIEILDQAGSREFAESKAREMAGQAMAALDGFASETRSTMEDLAHWALDGSD